MAVNYNLLPCYPAYKTVNRADNRAQWFEFEHNYKELVEIELMFANDLFAPLCEYNTIYTYYLEMWQKQCRFMKAHKMFKHTKLNEHYFEMIYKPEENIN